jgi:hypothetical protein
LYSVLPRMMYKRITAPQLPLESQTGCFAL